MIKLDDRDIRILEILQQEGRISKSELAKQVNLSTAACWERLKRLENNGVIEGYGARFSFNAALGLITIFVQVEMNNHRAEDFKKFENAIQDIPEITECWAVGGGVDYFLKVVCANVDFYQRLIDQLLDRDLGVKRYFTYIVTKPVKNTPVPLTMLQP